MTNKEQLKETVKSFLDTDFPDSDYGSLPSAMFLSEFPEEGSKYNGEVELEILSKVDKLGLQVNFVKNFGGEGCGDRYWSIYSFTKNNETVYVQFDGWYASHYGSEFTEWFFVKPKEVTVTQFVQE